MPNNVNVSFFNDMGNLNFVCNPPNSDIPIDYITRMMDWYVESYVTNSKTSNTSTMHYRVKKNTIVRNPINIGNYNITLDLSRLY